MSAAVLNIAVALTLMAYLPRGPWWTVAAIMLALLVLKLAALVVNRLTTARPVASKSRRHS